MSLADEPDWILRLSYPSARLDLEDRVERALFLSRCMGSSIEENGEKTIVRLYFTTPELREEAEAMFPSDLSGLTLEREEAESVDWLDFYEHTLEPIEIGHRWLVVPDQTLLPEKLHDRIPLVIPQQRAFGTGSHESTALCLRMIEYLEMADKQVIDVGTGSGILVIAMRKRGAGRVVALDNDVDTWGIVRENMRRNGIATDHIELFFGTIQAIRSGVTFDLIVMNIIPEVIVPSLPDAERHLAPKGQIILSGILRDHASMVIDRAAESALRLVDHDEAGEWWCGRFGR